ncbi:hypothetical protein MXD62_04530 [Frankia sp. Mgl5]|nr:hypothetical protein [Frankia sp. Mgl5]
MSEQVATRLGSGRSRGRPARRLALRLLSASLVLLPVIAALFTGRYHARFHTWPWSSSLPDKVTYCDRDYTGPGRPVTWAEAGALENGTVRDVGRTRAGVRERSIYANPLSEQARERYNPPLPCAMAVYLRTEGDRVAPYVLSGGP